MKLNPIISHIEFHNSKKSQIIAISTIFVDDSILFVVNPHSNGGKTGKNWEKLYIKINDYMKIENDFVIADGIGQGVLETLKGIDEGYNRIVAVGGDGSINEVVNGIYKKNSKDVKLGILRGGTVNDYLQTINYPKELEKQLEIIQGNNFVSTPLIEVFGDNKRLCLNAADTGVSALAAYMASVQRKLIRIPGALRYYLLAINAIRKWKNINLTISSEKESFDGNLSLLIAGFSYRVGNYRVLPHAEPYGENFAFTAAFEFSKVQMLRLMGTLRRGEHTEEIKGVYMRYASELTLEASEPILFEVDGEPCSTESTTIEIKKAPNKISILI